MNSLVGWVTCYPPNHMAQTNMVHGTNQMVHGTDQMVGNKLPTLRRLVRPLNLEEVRQ